LWSQVLGYYLGVEEGWLRLYDREGRMVLTGDELARQERAARQAAEKLARQERAARQAAEELARQERDARQAAEELAQQERAARQAAETELARLREELTRLKSSG